MITGGGFFIVDNTDEHWKALEYLRQWCAISNGLDIATGHFNVGSCSTQPSNPIGSLAITARVS